MINNRQAGRRRGRGGQRSQGGNPGRGPENGNRIDNRARGNAAQLLEKYKALARDAQMQGDRVNTEYYLQFADHYFRVLAETRSRFEENQPRRSQNDQFDDGDEDDFGNAGDAIEDDRGEAYANRGGERGNGADRGNDRGDRQGRDGGRDGNRNGQRNDRSANGYDVRANGARPGDDDDGAARPSMRRDRDRNAAGDEAREEAAAAPVMRDDADRPRRGRQRRPIADEGERDSGDDAATIEADRLPASLALSATGEGEEKPRRRRGRPAAAETTPAE